MIEVHILLNMFLNFISYEIILPMYFDMREFEPRYGLSYTEVFKFELDFENNSVSISVGQLNQF